MYKETIKTFISKMKRVYEKVTKKQIRAIFYTY